MAHRQQRRAIVAVHGRDRRGDRRVKQGRGGVYRHFTNARATIVISHTQADYRHFRFTAALSSFRLRLSAAGKAWRYRHSGFAFSSLWIRFFVRADSPRGKFLPKKRGFLRLSGQAERSEEHTSELQSLMRISYAVFCLKKKKHKHTYKLTTH